MLNLIPSGVRIRNKVMIKIGKDNPKK